MRRKACANDSYHMILPLMLSHRRLVMASSVYSSAFGGLKYFFCSYPPWQMTTMPMENIKNVHPSAIQPPVCDNRAFFC